MAKGHRKRMRERLLNGGINSFDDYQIMEMLLFEFLPRIDTYPVAHRLIDKFGSVTGVIEAPFEELILVDGIGKKTAEKLNYLGALTSLTVEKILSDAPMSNQSDVAAYLVWVLKKYPVDSVCIMYLSGRNMLIDRKLFSSFAENERSIIEEIEREARRVGAKKVIIAHKHPEDDVTPSADDLNLANAFLKLSAKLEIVPAGNYIVSGTKAVNIAEERFESET